MLPNFLIIGAAKAGTTSLYHYLRQHPDVFMSAVKEPDYFCAGEAAAEPVPVGRLQDYERLFQSVTSERAVGEASTKYLNSLTAVERIAAELRHARLIVSLRNPADRAYSRYLGRLRGARERCGLDEAMRSDSEYVLSSRYYDPLTRYLSRFGNRRVKVILFDDLVADRRAVVRDLFSFLDVDPGFEPDVARSHNTGGIPRSMMLNSLVVKGSTAVRTIVPALRDTGVAAWAQRRLMRPHDPLPPAIRRRVLDGVSDDIAKTGKLIGRDLSAWLN